MVNIPTLITEQDIVELMKSEARKVSANNGFYWWELETPIIETGKKILLQHASQYYEYEITKQQFVMHLHTYFKVIYDESLKAWKEKYKYVELGEDEVATRWYDPIPTATLTTRELHYINWRWETWCAREGEYNLEGLVYEYNPRNGEFFIRTPFDNKFPEQEYEPYTPSKVIHSLDYVMRFGKRKDWSLKLILERDVKYFQWLLTIDKLEFSDEIKKQVERQFLKEAFWD